MARVPVEIVLTEDETATLESWPRWRNTKAGLHLRAGIVLDCAHGYSGEEIAERHRTSQQTVSKWRQRFARDRLAGLSDAPRSGQPRKHGDEAVQAVLDATLNRRPKNATHWSVRGLSEDLGISRGFVHRVWRAFGLKPHLTHSFKLSTDPHFVEKVRDIVGLYLDPPDKALVLCVDEKSQIQALDRTQPSLPLSYGLPEPIRMIIGDTAQRRCLPPWTWRLARSLANSSAVIEAPSSSVFYGTSIPRCQQSWMYT